ncbi:uncharacterized protein DUF1399 [Xenorhabdus cabanillasii]|uniref:Uncharacterized protein DUF1399 n=2 Tax=Xenorhabdus cabanillasii TaxID=351673 RepID=A0A3D9U9D0_9GAMM|nr:uncharacterized protein DUF1399 [Xenorhabdus cabanillasii]
MTNKMNKKEFLKKMESVNFENIIKKITKKHPNIARVWTEEGARDAVEQYKKFMFIVYKYENGDAYIAPSIEVDEIWHHHILDTKNYKKDCENIFGYFVHHFSYFPSSKNEEDTFKSMNNHFMKTQELYFKEFGEHMYEVDF